MPTTSNTTPKLRAPKPVCPMHVVLVEPEIPPNTGNIARLCGATGSILHLVGTLGFRIDAASVRRAGLDYWHLVEVLTHKDFSAFLEHFNSLGSGGRLHLFSGLGRQSYLDRGFRPGDALVFGKESVGLPQELLDAYPADVIAIPMPGAVRSLNLSNAVAIGLYDALRQSGGLDGTEFR